jgi:hypothetical protein
MGDPPGKVKYTDNPFLAARKSGKYLFRSTLRQNPWGPNIREVPVKELATLFTGELMLDCTIPEGEMTQ